MEALRWEGCFPAERIVLLDTANWRSGCARLFSASAGVVAMRFHASILALLFGIPLTAVVYDPKVESLAADWMIPSWSGFGPFPEPGMPENTAKVADKSTEFLETFSKMCAAVLRQDAKE